MKKELALHLLTTLFLFVLIFIAKYLNIRELNENLFFLPYLAGGILGTILPDIDHIIYVYYLRPYEVTSQRVMYETKKGNLLQSLDLLARTRSERTNLILHTVIFQIIFLILSFRMVTASASLFGRGLILAFLLHLLVDEIIDLRQTGNLQHWFKNIPIQLDQMQVNIYLIGNAAVILIFAFLV